MKRAGRARRVAVTLLVIFGCILAPLSVISVWTRNTLLDTDQYVSTVGPLAKDPAVITAAAGLVTEQVLAGTDVQARLAAGLPERVKFAAPAIANGLEQVVNRAALRILESPRFATVWERANRRAHEQVAALLTGKGGKAFSTNNGQVLLNLTPVVERVRKRLDQLGINVFDNVNATRVNRQFVLVDSKDLEQVQGAVDLLQKLAIVLPILTLVAFGAAIALSSNRRRTILRSGIGLAIAMVVLLTAFNLARSVYLDAFPKVTGKAAGSAVYDQVLGFLRLSARTVAAVGIVAAISAWLAGPSPTATRLRGLVTRTGEAPAESSAFATWVARHTRGLRFTVITAAAIALVAIEHPSAFTVLLISIVTVALLAAVELTARTGAAALPASGVATGTPGHQ